MSWLRHVAAGLQFLSSLVFAAWGVPSLISAAEKIPDQGIFRHLDRISLAASLSRARISQCTHYVSFILFWHWRWRFAMIQFARV